MYLNEPELYVRFWCSDSSPVNSYPFSLGLGTVLPRRLSTQHNKNIENTTQIQKLQYKWSITEWHHFLTGVRFFHVPLVDFNLAPLNQFFWAEPISTGTFESMCAHTQCPFHTQCPLPRIVFPVKIIRIIQEDTQTIKISQTSSTSLV